ncbi:hypothetical protein IFR04_011615 [Cadophora malorum]|uniref:Uncharacterized protein n=1 Tax=Cadophora malorum TaxID=108018 RepID=A0A8H7W7L0_9HELO|nr:hypothetical protein IFR04_011615 [Cadophora malorum]
MAPSALEQSAKASISVAPNIVPKHAGVQPFFESVSKDGFLQGKSDKAQPWRAHVTGLEHPFDDEKLWLRAPSYATTVATLLEDPSFWLMSLR